MKVTGLSYRQIQYWDKRIVSVDRRIGKDSKARYRSFKINDVVAYKVCAELRSLGISLQRVRKTFLPQLEEIMRRGFREDDKVGLINDQLVVYDGNVYPQVFTELMNYEQLLRALGLVVVTEMPVSL